MKAFEQDWTAVLAALPAWDALPAGARRAALEMKPSAGASVRDLQPWAEAIAASGLADATGRRLVPRPEARPLLVVLRALDRQRVWDAPTPEMLADYLKEHLTTEEGVALLHGAHFLLAYVDRRALADRVSAEEWVEGFLAADTHAKAREWERARLARGEAPRFARAEVWEAARGMVRGLLALAAPVPLRELAERFGEVDAPVRAAALEAALRHLLLFAGMREDGLEAAVGPWPEVAARMGSAAPRPPAPVEAVESFEAAWAMEDLTTVLVAASAEPIRLRAADGEVFARTREAIATRLVALPPWVEELTGLKDPGGRVEAAAALLRVLKLADVGRGDALRLVPTRAGTAWLGLSDRDRLAGLIDPLRASGERNPQYGYYGGVNGYGFFPVSVSGPVRAKGLDLRAALSRAFLSLPEGFVPVRAFLDHVRRVDNPLLESARAGKPPIDMYWGGRTPQRRDWERVWGEIVAAFLVFRLVALGGTRLGRTAGGEACFALTEAGRYLLGAAEGFEYGHAQGGEGGVIVQPNFEIVFLAPAPRLEAQMARFAHRVGSGVGVLFRVTRASVLAAAEAGMSEAQVVKALGEASARELPANVARQLRDWFSAVRRVRMRPALLMDCPDAETAAKVRAAAGSSVRALTATVLEFPEMPTKERTALVKKLRTAGVFVQ